MIQSAISMLQYGKARGENYMKKRHSILALVLTICMVLSCSAFPTFAASGNYVNVQVTQNYSDAQQILKLINKQRAKRGLKKLKLDRNLTDSAVKRAIELTVYIPEQSPHRRPNGKVGKSINKKITYECCAEGYTSAKSVMSGWMSSPPHKRGILLKGARSVGIGCVTSENGDKFWTLEFSTKKAKKKETRTTAVTKTIKVIAKATYLTKKHFWMGLSSDDMFFEDEVYVGETTRVGVFYHNNFDFNTMLRGADFTWTSSNPAIATVDAYGRITAKAAGTVTIKAKMKIPLGYAFSTQIYVEDPGAYDDEYYW